MERVFLHQIALFSLVLLPFLCSCGQGGNRLMTEDIETRSGMVMKLVVEGRSFEIKLADTDVARELVTRLPLTLAMSELNGNEKYCNLSKPLPVQAKPPRRVEIGDMMLWGDDCLVIFYKSFDTPYSYTYIGKIANTTGFADALGSGNVTVILQADMTMK